MAVELGTASPRLRATVAAYLGLAVACVVVLGGETARTWVGLPGWQHVALTVGIVAAGVTVTVPLGFGNRAEQIDITGACLGLAIALVGPGQAALALITGKIVVELARRRRPIKAVVNVAAFTVAATCASQLCLLSSGGTPGLAPASWPCVALAALVFTVVVAVMVNAVIFLAQHDTWRVRLSHINRVNACGDAVICVGALAEWRFSQAAVLLTPALAWTAMRVYRNTTALEDEGSVIDGLGAASAAVKTLDARAALDELAERCTALFGVTDLEVDLENWPPTGDTWQYRAGGGRSSVFAPLPALSVKATVANLEAGSPGKWWQIFPIVAGDELLGTLRMRAGERTPRRAERTIMDAYLATTTTALHHARGHLRELQAARHDPLTGLANRAGFEELGTAILSGAVPLSFDRTAEDHQPPVSAHAVEPELTALLFLDLDHFKPINDRYGHDVGDQLLVAVAARLRAAIRTHDIVGRIGGDEFLVMLRDVGTAEQAVQLAQETLRRLRAPLLLAGRSITVGGTIGIATTRDARTLEDLKRCADIAMYVAKRNGRGTVAVYTPNSPSMPESIDLLDDLEAGIRRGELVVLYQPKVDLESGRIVGAEALVRWDHPSRGLLRPDQFLPPAERHPVIVDLTHIVLETAIIEAVSWRNGVLPVGAEPRVAVNVARGCLTHRGFPGQVIRLLAVHGLPTASLTLEITESTELDTSETVDQVLAELRVMGVKLSVDDFGTGYSSMSFFQRVAVDEVKIDGTFVRAMVESPAAASIVRSTVELGHGVGIPIVAEGIETARQLAEVTAAGADIGQGYYLGQPMAAEDFQRALFDSWHPVAT